jgi:transposase
LLEGGAVARRRGRPRHRPDRVIADKAYTGQPIRSYLRQHGIGADIPYRAKEHHRGLGYDRTRYALRARIECRFRQLKEHRAIATRYDKLEAHYHGMVTLACILCWL